MDAFNYTVNYTVWISLYTVFFPVFDWSECGINLQIYLISQDMQKNAIMWTSKLTLMCLCKHMQYTFFCFSFPAERCSITTEACQTPARLTRPCRFILGISSMWAALVRRSGGPLVTSAPHRPTAPRSESSPAAGGQVQKVFNPPSPPLEKLLGWEWILLSPPYLLSHRSIGDRQNLMGFWNRIFFNKSSSLFL